MVTPLNYYLKRIAPVLAALTLSACASSDERYEAPSYASMYDGDTYRVICTGLENRDIYVRYDALDSFYHPDGALKSRDEFCLENASGARQR
ncbi:hypothetical protein [Pseudohongiella sp.]|uniref:Uncharacterized protein n=1 Tax=marine sediment metagenome TaxID=412755 RepID=A0A0F9VY80_9ZZZZ|nr:hypothetical protein [Pseudohongiella sp.]HDZ07975.1 hypothetical protein [Pseudohongiella sp.]HEA64418.1 hypothetical protein [Pseudohongiella sp.]